MAWERRSPFGRGETSESEILMSVAKTHRDWKCFEAGVQSQHLRLRVLLRGIEEIFDARSAERESESLVSALHALLTDLNAELPQHFDFEEKTGYFVDIENRAPHRSRELETLRHEHEDFAERTRLLLDRFHDAVHESIHWAEVEDRFTSLSNRLRSHEERENRLIQEVMTMDFGDSG